MSQTPNGPAGPRINLRGAVDLSGLSRSGSGAGAAPSGTGSPGAPGAAGVVVDVTEATFEGLVQQSTTYPVVFDLGAPSNEGSRQLTAVLERLAAEHAGAFLLAKVDAMSNPQFAQVFRVEAIPTVVAVVKGQPVPLFQGAMPEEQVRQVLDQLLQVAAANGVTGRVPVADTDHDGDPAEPDEEAEEELPPLHAEAYDAIERGDMDAAADAYRRAIAQNPGDDMAKAGLAQVELLRRTAGADLETARAAAAGNPTDVDAQLLVADLDVLGGHVEDAFVRLVDTVRATTADDRERVRLRLVELFEVVGATDPRVVAARRALASALF